MRLRPLLNLILFIPLITACTAMPTSSPCLLKQLGLPSCIVMPDEVPDQQAQEEHAWPSPSPEFLAEFNQSDPFPLDPSVQVGQLDNGLMYYIVPNDDPPDRANFALVVDAGSIDEDDDQLGVAHFLEHMLFNGTENFSPEELRLFFEANGMTLGQHLNAGTGYEQTTYYLNVDASNPEVMAKTFLVLGDWAHRALLEQTEVDKEKGVVEEEWRLRTENAQGRIQEKILQTLLAGSRYVERDVIGDMEVIRELSSETLSRFYEDWYRPDLMTLVAVGSVEPLWIEEQIQVQFGALDTDPATRPSVETAIPLQEEISVAIFSDPELTTVSLDVLQLITTEPVEILGDARRILAEDLAIDMLNERLDRISRSADSEFQSARFGTGLLGIGGVSYINLTADLDEAKVIPGFTAALTELVRAKHFGFTEGELLRAKLNLLERFEREFEGLPTRRNRQIQSEVLNHILYASPMSGIGFEFELAKHYLPNIGLDEVNVYIADTLDVTKSLVLLTAPEKEGLDLPSEDDLHLAIDKAVSTLPEPYEDDGLAAGTQLMDELPPAAEILGEEYDERLDLTILSYSNGLTALLKPTKLEENSVLLEIVSKGGNSLVEDEEFFAAGLVSRVARESGVGPFDFNSLEQLLAGKSANLRPYLGEVTEGYKGNATTQDLEILFQLAHLSIIRPRFEEDSFRNVLDDRRVNLQNQELDPFYQLLRQLRFILFGDAVRETLMLASDLDTIEFSQLLRIYSERLGALDEPTLILTGDFNLEEGKQLASTYLGSLPQVSSAETWQDRSTNARSGPYLEQVYHGQGSQVFVVQMLINDQISELSPEDDVAMEALSRILSTRYDQQLREELGGTYSAQATVSASRIPRPSTSLVIFFVTNEEEHEILMSESREILQAILQNGPTEKEVDAAKAQLQLQLETSQTTNRYWSSAFLNEFVYGDADLELIDRRLEYIENITREQINELVPLVIDPDSLVELIQLPEDSAPSE